MAESDVWTDLLGLDSWTPLSNLRVQAHLVEGGLYQWGPSAFLLGSSYGPDLIPDPMHAPYVTLVGWAPSVGVARRVWLLQKEADDLATGAPPLALIPPGATPAYASLVEVARASGAPTTETATYRIATDGAFLFRTLSAGRWAYHFRRLDENPDEAPMAVAKLLRRRSHAPHNNGLELTKPA